MAYVFGSVFIDDLLDPYSNSIRILEEEIKRNRNPINLNYYASLLHCNGQNFRALEVVEQCLRESPRNSHALYLKAMLYLDGGNYPEGFDLFEERYDAFSRAAAEATGFKDRRWGGQETDETVLIWQEGGFGDALQFIRHYPEVRQRAPNAILAVHPSLFSLFKNSGITGDMVPVRLRDGINMSGVNATRQCSLMSLPFVLQNPIPKGKPYLQASDNLRAWAAATKNNGQPKIGFVSQGNPTHERAATRKIPNDIAAKFRDEVPVLSLAVEDLKTTDWHETAAVVANLDLVIAVDTAIVHLAAAMGKRTWVLINVDHDWRWQRYAEGNPFYDSVRVFRCPGHGQWEKLLYRVREALEPATLQDFKVHA